MAIRVLPRKAHTLLSFVLALTSTAALAMVNIDNTRDKGVYQLGSPERGKTRMNLGFGTLGDQAMMAATACKPGCPIATYNYLKEESKTLNRPVFFNPMGLYVIRYDADSFVVVQPDGILGRQVWTKIRHANIYSKNAGTAKSVNRAKIEAFAIEISSKIMNQDTGIMAHAQGTYHLAAPHKHLGRTQSSYEISFEGDLQKSIVIEPCKKCPTQTYTLLPEETAITGVDVYRYATSDYLFDMKDGVLAHTFANAGGLGSKVWDKYSHFNVFSNNQAYIRQLLTSTEKQTAIDNQIATYFSAVKKAFEERQAANQAAKTAKRELPDAGMRDAIISRKAFSAANNWASAWQWKETLKRAYMVSNDWSIVRNQLSGIITGRNITGVVTMTHPDSRCRFQYMTFRQDYDGSQYMNLRATGIGPIYDISCSKLN